MIPRSILAGMPVPGGFNYAGLVTGHGEETWQRTAPGLLGWDDGGGGGGVKLIPITESTRSDGWI